MQNENITKGDDAMYPNLRGQKAYHRLTNEDMANIINVTRMAYESKMKSGRFTVIECRKYCEYFNKSFEFLFALGENE